MATEIADLFNPTDSLTVSFGNGGKVPLQYSRLEVTSNMIDPNTTDQNALAVCLSKVVTAWDLTYKGVVIPAGDAAAIATLPLAFQQTVLKAIIEDQNISPN